MCGFNGNFFTLGNVQYKGLYKDVCTEYTKNLNEELKTTYKKMRNELDN